MALSLAAGVVHEQPVLGKCGQAVGFDECDQQQEDDDGALDTQEGKVLFDQRLEQPRCPNRDNGVQHSEQERCAVEAQLGYQSIAYRWAENLRSYRAAEPQRFVWYYDQMAPESAIMLARAAGTAQP